MLSDARGATAYVARHTSTGQGLSKPCAACEEALRAAGVRKVVYSTTDGIETEEY